VGLTSDKIPMNEDIRRIRDDISFIRSVTEDDGTVLRASATGLLVAGTVFGLNALRAFALGAGWLHWPEVLRPFLPFDAVVLFFLLLLPLLALQARGRPAPVRSAMSATSRAVWASWAAVGIGYGATALSLALAGSHAAGNTVFAFWGGGWLVAAAAYRRMSLALVALGCYLAAIGAGLLAGGPYSSLLMAVAMWLLVALPGLLVLHHARAPGRI
jgi:hypothetical protein